MREDTDYTTERILKIEGTEYLPKGFLELEPLLYKDEYEFNCPQSEKNFDMDQRKAKELRRQQYNNRNFAKVREVVIIKVEYLKDRARRILEQWFEGNNSQMDRETIEMLADELELGAETIQKLHDMFIEDRALFGKDKDEINRLIYNDKRQQTLSRLQTQVEPTAALSPATKAFDPKFKEAEESKDRHASTLPADRKRRSKHSRQRARMRSKSNDRDSTPKKGVQSLISRKESGHLRKLRTKEQRLLEEEERLREIEREAIKGEEEARLKVERAIGRRKHATAKDGPDFRDEYSRAKAELEDFTELRKQAEQALVEAMKETEAVRREIESQKLVFQFQTQDEILEAKKDLEKAEEQREIERSEKQQREEKALRDEVDKVEKDRVLREDSLRQKKLGVEREAAKKRDQEVARDRMKRATVALIDKKVKEEEERKSSQVLSTEKSAARENKLGDKTESNQMQKNKTIAENSSKHDSRAGSVQENLRGSRESRGSKDSSKKKNTLNYSSEKKQIRIIEKNGSASKKQERGSPIDSKTTSQEVAKRASAVEDQNSGTDRESQDLSPSRESSGSAKMNRESFEQSRSGYLMAVDEEEHPRDHMNGIREHETSRAEAGAPADPDESVNGGSGYDDENQESLLYDSMKANQVESAHKILHAEASKETQVTHRAENGHQSYADPLQNPSNPVSATKSKKLEFSRSAAKVKQSTLHQHGNDTSAWQRVDCVDDTCKNRSGGRCQTLSVKEGEIGGDGGRQDEEDGKEGRLGEPAESEVEEGGSMLAGQEDQSEEYGDRGQPRDESNYESEYRDDVNEMAVADENSAREESNSADAEDEREENPHDQCQSNHKQKMDSGELEELLENERRKIRSELQQEFEEKLARAKQEAIEETMTRKDTYNKICRRQLWDMFLEYCKEVSRE